MRKSIAAGLGGVGAALLGALCCMGPLIFVAFGVGAGLAATFEPLRPLFGVVMAGLFGLAFYTVYHGRPSVAGTGASDAVLAGACAAPRSRSSEKLAVWAAALLALVLWTFPAWSSWLIWTRRIEKKLATVTYEPEKVKPSHMIAVLKEKLRYTAKVIEETS